MKSITIKHSSGEYPVLIAADLLTKLPRYLAELDYDKTVFIIDKNVYRLHKEKLSGLIKSLGKDTPFIVPPGEFSKSFQRMENIHKYLLGVKCTRHSVVIGIGGGVTGDLAGFAASTFMRGVKFINIPTTLVSASDSAIGGKTGINFGGLKNIIGSFYHPSLVIIDTEFFNTLPDDVYRAGLGEVIKYGYLAGNGLYTSLRDHFKLLLGKDQDFLINTMVECLNFKGGVTSTDEREVGLRKVLNLGHTFAHGFESASGFHIPHGFAVHGGIIASIYLSQRLGVLTPESFNELLSLALGLSPSKQMKNLSPAEVFKYMLGDKKNKGGGAVRFVLIKEPGCILTDVPASREEVIAAIKDLQKLF